MSKQTYHQKYYSNHKKEFKEYHKRYREIAEHKEMKKKYDFVYNTLNKEKIRKYKRDWARKQRLNPEISKKHCEAIKKHYQTNRIQILSRMKQYYQLPETKKIRKEYNKKIWLKRKNDVILRAYMKKYLAKYNVIPINKQRIRLSKNKYKQINWQELSIKNKEYAKRFRKTKRGKLIMIMNSMKRYARKKISDCNITEKDLTDIRNKYPVCVYCSSKQKLTFDHIKPITKGGLGIRENLVIACNHCNSSKRTQELEKWFSTAYCIIHNINWNNIHPDIQKLKPKIICEVSL